VIYYGGRIQAQGPLHQLLAKPDSVRITAPVLSRETTDKVLNLIRAEVGDTVRLENPTQNLESYFLGVVEAARRQAETSGATSGNRVAEYLRGDGQGPAPTSGQATHQAESVLERLSRPTESAAPVVSEVAAPSQPSAEAVLESLVRHEAPAPQAPSKQTPAAQPASARGSQPAQPAEAAKPVDLSKANDALSGLLGNKGGKK